MKKARPYILSIAGFDPSAGAGVLADTKTIEWLHCYAMAAVTANTVQTADEFVSINWVEFEVLKNQIQLLLDNYEFKVVKIGLIRFDWLSEIVTLLKSKQPHTVIVWDPILSATAGFDFEQKLDLSIVAKVDWITPNWNEIMVFGDGNALDIAQSISTQTNVFLKGGHSSDLGKDLLFLQNKKFVLNPRNGMYTDKHGTGCVLSSALSSYLARGFSDFKSAFKAKRYIERILASNPTKLAYHK